MLPFFSPRRYALSEWNKNEPVPLGTGSIVWDLIRQVAGGGTGEGARRSTVELVHRKHQIVVIVIGARAARGRAP